MNNKSVYLTCWRDAVVCSLAFVLLWSRLLYAETAINSTSEGEMKLVWSTNYGQGEQVYYSSFEKNTWSAPVQLSTGSELVFLPAVSSGDDGTIWVVWSRKENKGSRLEYTFYNASGWSQPAQINTGLESNTVVSVIVDPNNTPWIAWEGIDNTYEDIFWSRWDGGEWVPPAKAHDANNVPDLHPSLSLDDSGTVVLSWQTFANGKYIAVSQLWDGKQWQTTPSETADKIFNKTSKFRQGMASLPKCIQDPRKATLFIKDGRGSWSVPLSKIAVDSNL